MSTHSIMDAYIAQQHAPAFFKTRLHAMVCKSSSTSSWFSERFLDGTLLSNVENLDEVIKEVVASAAAAILAAETAAKNAAEAAAKTAAEAAAKTAAEAATNAEKAAAAACSFSFAKALVSPYASSYTKSYLKASVPASTPEADVPRAYTIFYNKMVKVSIEPMASTNSADPALHVDSLAPTPLTASSSPPVSSSPPACVWVAIRQISDAFDLAESDVQYGTDFGTYGYLNIQALAAFKVINGDRAPIKRAEIWIEPHQEENLLEVGTKRSFENVFPSRHHPTMFDCGYHPVPFKFKGPSDVYTRGETTWFRTKFLK